jgi:hypothetical protein
MGTAARQGEEITSANTVSFARAEGAAGAPRRAAGGSSASAGPLLDVDTRVAYREPGEERDAASGFWAGVDDARQASTLTKRATRQLESLNGGLQATSRRMGAVAERLERWGAANGMPGAQEYREKLEREKHATWRRPLPPVEPVSGRQPRIGAPAADEPDLAGSSSSSGGKGAQKPAGEVLPIRGAPHAPAAARGAAGEADGQGGAAEAALDDAARLLDREPAARPLPPNSAQCARLDALIRQQRAALDAEPLASNETRANKGGEDEDDKEEAEEEKQDKQEKGGNGGSWRNLRDEDPSHAAGDSRAHADAAVSPGAGANEMPADDVQDMLLGDNYGDAALLDGLLGVSAAQSGPVGEPPATADSGAPLQLGGAGDSPLQAIVGPAARQRLRERTDRVAERIEAEARPHPGQQAASCRPNGTEDAQLEELFLELRQLVGAVDDAAGERADHHGRIERALLGALEDERKARGGALRRLDALSEQVLRLDARQRELARQQARREAAGRDAEAQAREQHERRAALSALNVLEGQRALQSSFEALGGRVAQLGASHAKVVHALQLSERETAALRRELRESLNAQVERLREESERERLKTQMLYDYMRRAQQEQAQQATYIPTIVSEDEGRRQRRTYHNGGTGGSRSAKSGVRKRPKR